MRLNSITLLVSASLSSMGSVVEALAPQAPFDCSQLLVDGYKYDLSALNKEWTVEGRIPLRFNPCSALSYYNDACPRGQSYMCAMDPASPQVGRANIGVPTEIYRNPKNELVLLFSRGSYDLNGFPFVSLVRFECDTSTVGTGPVEPVSDGSKYFLIWKTKAGCPVATSASTTGSFFATLFSWALILLLIYFVAGYLFNLIVVGKNGSEALPHHHFWSEVGGFTRELFSNIQARLTGSSGGYQQI